VRSCPKSILKALHLYNVAFIAKYIDMLQVAIPVLVTTMHTVSACFQPQSLKHAVSKDNST